MIRLGTDLGIFRDLASHSISRTIPQLCEARGASPELLGN